MEYVSQNDSEGIEHRLGWLDGTGFYQPALVIAGLLADKAAKTQSR